MDFWNDAHQMAAQMRQIQAPIKTFIVSNIN